MLGVLKRTPKPLKPTHNNVKIAVAVWTETNILERFQTDTMLMLFPKPSSDVQNYNIAQFKLNKTDRLRTIKHFTLYVTKAVLPKD